MKRYVIIPVLQKEESFTDMIIKMKEEVEELERAVMKGDKENITEESYDVIQVAVGFLDKLKNELGVDIAKSSQDHLIKLHNRGWIIKRVLEIR